MTEASHWKSCGKSDSGSDYNLFVVADQEATHRIALNGNAWLLVHERSDSWLEFAVFEFNDGPATRNGVEVSPEHHVILLRGEGSAGLRECRHIWWGDPDDGGYTFYLNFATVEAALKELRRWFDGD